jgi:hypothetical protein
MISFLPVEGQTGPAATAAIENGRYQLNRKQGPVAGPHRVVVIVDYDAKAAFFSGPQGRGPGPPARSPRRWESEVNVPEEGPFEYNVTMD